MPQGHRSHELERESRRAFVSSLPSSWIARDIYDEYGIDMEVEILQKRRTTGLIFKVQLKATDGVFIDSAPSVRIKRDTFNYWWILDSPVLIVLYVSDSWRLFARWVHGISSAVAPGREPGETLTISFSADHEIREGFADHIYHDMVALKAFREHRVPLPLPVTVSISEGLFGFSEIELLTRLRQLVSHAGVLRIHTTDAPTSQLAFSSSGVEFALPARLSTSIFHFDAGYPSDALTLAADVLVSASLSFAAVGMQRDAVDLALSVRKESSIFGAPQVIAGLVGAFLSQGRAREALEILIPMITHAGPDVRFLAELLLIPLVLKHGRRLSDNDREALVSALEERASIEAQESLASAGRTWYTIAQYNRRHPHYERALLAMERALNFDPGYAERAYYYRDLGGILYELERGAGAVDAYRRALELGADASTSFLLADVLMLTGRYQEALDAARAATESAAPFGMQARLHVEALTHIIEVTGLGVQDRNSWSNEQFTQYINDHEDVALALRDSDALDLRLWMMAFDRNDGAETAFKSMLVMSCLTTSCPTTWVLAIAACIDARGQEDFLTRDLIDTAFRFVDTELLDTISSALVDFAPEDIERVREVVLNRGLREQVQFPAILRLVQLDGTYEEINLD